jgi:hypothetical protein
MALEMQGRALPTCDANVYNFQLGMSDLNAHSRGEHELNLLTSPPSRVTLRVGTDPRERFMHVTCCVSLVFISLRMNPDFLQVSPPPQTPPLAHPNFIFFHPRLYVPPTVNSRTFLVCTGRLITSVLWVCA